MSRIDIYRTIRATGYQVGLPAFDQFWSLHILRVYTPMLKMARLKLYRKSDAIKIVLEYVTRSRQKKEISIMDIEKALHTIDENRAIPSGTSQRGDRDKKNIVKLTVS